MLSRRDANRNTSDWSGGTPRNERLKVPRIRMDDGPQGFRDDREKSTTTAWQASQAYSFSWDRELVEEWGKAMGKEFDAKGGGVQLGPALNVQRIAVNGRNFEYISGEDPYLGAELAGPLTRGIQSQGVMADMKHFVNNNQETNRLG